MAVLTNILYQAIVYLTPVLLCVLGGLFAYKANVLNIALEGMMMAGAFTSVLVMSLTGHLALAYLAALVVSLLLGAIFAWAGVQLNGNVIVIGLAINMLVPAIAGFVMKTMQLPSIALPHFSTNALLIRIPFLADIPIVGALFSGHPIMTYVSYVLIAVVSVLLYRTPFGVHVRVVGEHAEAAVSLGLKTGWYKWAAILIGAGCCGLAGVDLALERLALYTNQMTAGRGFIAIAAIYCGRGRPIPCAVYTLLFSLAYALAEFLSLKTSASLLIKATPYVVMVLVLSAASLLSRRQSLTRGAFPEKG